MSVPPFPFDHPRSFIRRSQPALSALPSVTALDEEQAGILDEREASTAAVHESDGGRGRGRPIVNLLRPPAERPWFLWLQHLLPVLLFVTALGFYLPRLAYPDAYLFDEILSAYTAGEYAAGNASAYLWDDPCSVLHSDAGCVKANPDAMRNGRVGKYQWDHPPFGRNMIAVGILLFGNNSFGWRISNAVFGAMGIVIAYFLGMKLSGRRIIGLLTAGLLLFDGLYFVYSRAGLIDLYVAVVMMGALLAFMSYLSAPPDRISWPLFVTGVLLGLGIATKWNAGYAALLIGLVTLGRLGRLLWLRRRGDASPEERNGIREHLIWIPFMLGAVPASVYLLTYTPFFLEGYSLAQFIDLQKTAFKIQTTLHYDNAQSSQWWQWPLALRPVWFGNRLLGDGRIASTYANGNPILYWAFLPAMAWVCFHWWRTRRTALIVLAIGFFGQWLPWIFVEKNAYVYHFLPAVPFGCVAVATAIVHLCRGNTGWRRTLAIEYVVVVILVFAFFYPVYAYLPISHAAMALRMWFPSWRQ